MPVNKGKNAHLVIAFAWAIHALSWFLPAETESTHTGMFFGHWAIREDLRIGYFLWWLFIWFAGNRPIPTFEQQHG